MACAQAGKLEEHEDLKEHGKGIEALAMAQHEGGEVKMHHGRPLVCLNLRCGGNHYLRDCPKTSDQEKATIFAAIKEKWKAEGAAWKAKQANTIPGEAHMQVSIEDIDAKQCHQDNYLHALAFIQASKGNDVFQKHK